MLWPAAQNEVALIQRIFNGLLAAGQAWSRSQRIKREPVRRDSLLRSLRKPRRDIVLTTATLQESVKLIDGLLGIGQLEWSWPRDRWINF